MRLLQAVIIGKQCGEISAALRRSIYMQTTSCSYVLCICMYVCVDAEVEKLFDKSPVWGSRICMCAMVCVPVRIEFSDNLRYWKVMKSLNHFPLFLNVSKWAGRIIFIFLSFASRHVLALNWPSEKVVKVFTRPILFMAKCRMVTPYSPNKLDTQKEKIARTCDTTALGF